MPSCRELRRGALTPMRFGWTPRLKRVGVNALHLLLAAALSAAQPEPPTPHAFLERLCDDFGPRLTGSVANAGTITGSAAITPQAPANPGFLVAVTAPTSIQSPGGLEKIFWLAVQVPIT